MYELIDPFCLNIAGRVLPTVSPEVGPQQIGEIKDYLQFFVVVISWRKLENKKGEKDKGYIKVYGDNKDTCGGKWKIKDLLD